MTTEKKRRTSNVERRTPKAEKAKPNEIKSGAEFVAMVRDICTMQLEKERHEGRRDAKILKAQTEFAVEAGDLAKRIEDCAALAEKYAAAHRDELLVGKTKSGSTAFADFGFRSGPPSLVLADEKGTWDEVVDAIKAEFADIKEALIVTKESVNKNGVKSLLDDDQRAEIGTKLASLEKFFIEPRRDPADPRRLVGERKAA